MELPNGTILGIKSRPDQNVRNCVEPILRRHGLPYDSVVIHLVRNTPDVIHIVTFV